MNFLLLVGATVALVVVVALAVQSFFSEEKTSQIIFPWGIVLGIFGIIFLLPFPEIAIPFLVIGAILMVVYMIFRKLEENYE